MFKELIPSINNDIRRNKKAIISLGCSFVQGQGAIAQEIYDNYKWNSTFGNSAISWSFNDTEKKEIRLTYPEIKFYSDRNDADFVYHENKNSFVNVLCKKYFNNEYAAINLGIAGCGNRATIKELYYYPDILWNEIEEFIVIYCPSGAERFDFINDTTHDLNNHGRWISIWPTKIDEDSPRAELWNGYKTSVHSQKHEILEQISHIQELLLWCKYKNAKLIITPSFSRSYRREIFRESLRDQISRTPTTKLINVDKLHFLENDVKSIIDMWPWEKMFYPDNCPTFVDLIMKNEFPNSWEKKEYFYNYMGTGSPGKLITPCAHPSVIGHDLFAQHLHKHITENIL